MGGNQAAKCEVCGEAIRAEAGLGMWAHISPRWIGHHGARPDTRDEPTIEPASAPPNPILNSDSGSTSITTLASRENDLA